MKICFFDSGMGGLTLLAETAKLLPQAEYLYYADVLSCPLGNKTPAQIVSALHRAMDFFLSCGGFDAVVLACNTATGYGIGRLRKDLPAVPFFGVEPAVKPAAERVKEGGILVLSTSATAAQERFKALVSRYNARGNIIVAPQQDLASIIEQNFPHNTGAIRRAIKTALTPYKGKDIRAVVLGCTHYIYARNFVAEQLPQAEIFDGNTGTARRIAVVMKTVQGTKIESGKEAAPPLKKKIEALNLPAPPFCPVSVFNSARDEGITKKYFKILERYGTIGLDNFL